MFKNMCFMPRRADFTRPQFHRYYETQHTPLALRHIHVFRKYARNHVQSARPDVPFDTLTEFWFDDVAAAMSVGAWLQTPAGQVLRDDEAQFTERSAIRAFGVTESLIAGAPRGVEPGPTPTQALMFAKPKHPESFGADLAALGRRWAEEAGLLRVCLNETLVQPDGEPPCYAVLMGWPRSMGAESDAALERVAAAAAGLGDTRRLEFSTIETPPERLRG